MLPPMNLVVRELQETDQCLGYTSQNARIYIYEREREREREREKEREREERFVLKHWFA
jgi:hypothetical protein